MDILKDIQPELVWKYFKEISSVPRGSGNEKGICDYFENFAKENKLEYVRDKANNILIRKNASEGYEKAGGVILQGHMDMVCEKTPDSSHDFLKDPIKLVVDGDFLTADGTTLGGDDGIAGAMALAVLSDSSAKHPALEVLLTTDEEVGMNGARSFDCSLLKGKYLINLDSEEEGEIITCCAGGMRAELNLPLKRETVPSDAKPYQITINGLKGGHSGSDIHLQRASAIKLMGRFLYEIKNLCCLCEITGGNKDNAIPRETKAIICANDKNIAAIKEKSEEFEKIFNHEYLNVEYGIKINVETINTEIKSVLSKDTFSTALDMLNLIPYGVVTMSMSMKGLVESSTNIGVIRTYDDKITVISAPRSSVISRRDIIEKQFESIARLCGASLTVRGKYPAWEYREDSVLRGIMVETYKELFGTEPKVNAIHAGLECGLFSGERPDIDMTSIGPDMSGVHTTEEKLSIPSVARTYNYLLAILKNMN